MTHHPLLKQVCKCLWVAAAVCDPHRDVLESTLVELAGVGDRGDALV
jgi:hypothetical protein